MRLEADGVNTVIYRADQDVAWVIDHRDKSYRAIDRETTETVAQGMGQANAAARRYIEALPPAQRQAAERLLDRTLGSPTGVSPDIEMRASGANERIAGVPCAVYEVRRGGSRRAEVCRSTFEAAGVAGETRDAVRALADSLSRGAAGTGPRAPAPGRRRCASRFRRARRRSVARAPLRGRCCDLGDPRHRGGRAGGAGDRLDLPDGYARRLALGGRPQSAPAERSPR